MKMINSKVLSSYFLTSAVNVGGATYGNNLHDGLSPRAMCLLVYY